MNFSIKLFRSFSCMNKKEKDKKLAITAGALEDISVKPPRVGTSSSGDEGTGTDDSLEKSMAIPMKSTSPTDPQPFMSKVLADESLDTATRQNRSTPIDFNTREVKIDDDLYSNPPRQRISPLTASSPIPEETEDNLTELNAETPASGDHTLLVQRFERHSAPLKKQKKLARVYHSNNSSLSASSSSNDDSTRISRIRARVSRSASDHIHKSRRNSDLVGGSLRTAHYHRRVGIFDPRIARIFSVDTPHSRSGSLRLRKRGDVTRRDALEAGFEPRDGVPRCHSTQSLRDVQRVKAYSNSQFQASDLSLDPNGRVLAACDSSSGSVVAPMAIVNPAQSNHRLQHHHQLNHHQSYDKDIMRHDVGDRRHSIQALTGASSLYQMTNGSGGGAGGVVTPTANGRSQFSPSDLAVNAAPVHRVSSRVRVHSSNQICDSTSTPQFSIDQRRSVHNIGHPQAGQSSFLDGIKTTSTPKRHIAVAPLAHKSRHLSESRDEMRSERRGSGSGAPITLPAYTNYLMRHAGEERLVDGPVTNPSDARIAYLEKRIRELEMTQKEQSLQSSNQSRQSKLSHFTGSMSPSDQLRLQEMSDELMSKEKKVAGLESKLLKAYQRIERLNEEYDGKIKGLIYDGERARDDLTRCVEKINQLEHELDETRAVAQSGDHANEQHYHELRDKIWKQERELQENRTLLTRLREKEADFERMRSEKGYLELKNENLSKKLEAKKKAVEELERSVSSLRMEQTICQQSCSSGSTPLADEIETMSDIRPSLARPYTKAHSTLGSHMSPLSHSKASGLTKSFSNFALNSTKRDDITPMMSRTIRKQNRHITMCRAMVVCLKDTVDRMARGENPDVARLLGVKLNVPSESEMEDDEDIEADESKPFSMMSAESALSKQCEKLADLDKDLDTIRCQLADWHGQTSAEGEGDRDVCRVQ